MTSPHAILEPVSTGFLVRDPDPPTWPPSLPGEDELPFSDGEPMESEGHRVQMDVLIDSLWLGAPRDDLFVGGNMFVYFSREQVKHQDFRGPDVFVVLGTERRARKSWVYWRELRLPDVVIELRSPSTAHVDHGVKKQIYQDVWKTAVYVIYDPESHELFGHRLVGGTYEPIAADTDGAIDVHVLGLRLGVVARELPNGHAAPSLRWLDARGRPLPTRAEAGLARADEEKARADEEKARADEEKARADAAALQAETERERADRERARADALEAELQALRGRR